MQIKTEYLGLLSVIKKSSDTGFIPKVSGDFYILNFYQKSARKNIL